MNVALLNRRIHIRVVRVIAVAALLGTLLITAPNSTANAQGNAGGSTLSYSVADGQNSANADRLKDGALGTTEAQSWTNSGNRWSEASYPMTVTIDLGQSQQVDAISIFSGQVPFPEAALLTVSTSQTGADFAVVTTLDNPVYNRWSEPLDLAGTDARFIELRFDTMRAHFAVTELAVTGAVDEDRINFTATDAENSASANRLGDGVTGTGSELSWWNPAVWQASSYPMSAELDLGGFYAVDRVEYFVGNLNLGTDELTIASSTDPAGVVLDDHEWNTWATANLDGTVTDQLTLSFSTREARFNITEVRVFGQPAIAVPTPTPQPTATPEPTPTLEPTPTATPAPEPTATPEPTGTPEPEPTATPEVTSTPEPTPTPGAEFEIQPPLGTQPQLGPPPASVVRSHAFGHFPSDHLSQACIDRHNSYWTQGHNTSDELPADDPENLAYHTWHPALDVLEDGTVCDFGHEHGTNPTAAGTEMFTFSGGWPAFGYAAEKASLGRTGNRHEDHPGHKVTVATFGAAIGNGADVNDTLYDAGFECSWLSKIHQGSHSLDAFSNHLHEYFLTVMCGDGTEFSIKVMYTYGEANTFVEDNCSQDVSWTAGDDITFDSSILTGPEGQSVMPAMREQPVGNNSPNHRAFTCTSAVEWKDLETEVGWVDIWTELIKLERNDGSTALTVQPYYIVKNPGRIIEAYDGIRASEGEDQDFELPSQVIRTIDMCYDETTGDSLNRPFCEDAPASAPADWRSPSSPFNGTFRAVHFKASDLRNEGGDTAWCTDAFGHQVTDELPCEPGNIEQRAASFTNHWNDGTFSVGDTTNIAGSIWSETPHGDRIEAEPKPGGGYFGHVLGFELIIDNRDPDDDFDGVPDGANIRGEN